MRPLSLDTMAQMHQRTQMILRVVFQINLVTKKSTNANERLKASCFKG